MDDITGLPSPFELTGDDRWRPDGELLDLYDLKLDQRQIQKEAPPLEVVTIETTQTEEADHTPNIENPSDYDEFALWTWDAANGHEKDMWSEDCSLA